MVITIVTRVVISIIILLPGNLRDQLCLLIPMQHIENTSVYDIIVLNYLSGYLIMLSNIHVAFSIQSFGTERQTIHNILYTQTYTSAWPRPKVGAL